MKKAVKVTFKTLVDAMVCLLWGLKFLASQLENWLRDYGYFTHQERKDEVRVMVEHQLTDFADAYHDVMKQQYKCFTVDVEKLTKKLNKYENELRQLRNSVRRTKGGLNAQNV